MSWHSEASSHRDFGFGGSLYDDLYGSRKRARVYEPAAPRPIPKPLSGPDIEAATFELEQALWRAIDLKQMRDLVVNEVKAVNLASNEKPRHIRWDVNIGNRYRGGATHEQKVAVVLAAMRDKTVPISSRRLIYHIDPR